MNREQIKKWSKRIALDVLIICVAQYLLLLLLGFFAMDALMFAPQTPAYTWQTPFITNIGSQEKPLAAYWHPSSNATATILHSHGNAEEINDLADIFELLVQTNINVLAYDYPGYGLSAGKPTEKGCYQAAETAYAFLTKGKGIPPETIIILGRSLGSGPACYLAEKYPVKGLIFESAFLSAPRVVTRYRILPFDAFPNATRITNITCPKLFLHGTEDPVIPFWHGKKLYDVSTGDRNFYSIQGGGHNDLQLVLGYANYAHLIYSFVTKKSY
jgi:fermentation-respiration switch protein FrsA (DUF1100 family)